jgi:hypothetical protein
VASGNKRARIAVACVEMKARSSSVPRGSSATQRLSHTSVRVGQGRREWMEWHGGNIIYNREKSYDISLRYEEDSITKSGQEPKSPVN